MTRTRVESASTSGSSEEINKTATPEQAQQAHVTIRKRVAQVCSPAAAEQLVIQYGGSVTPDKAEGLLRQPDIDGGLIGGASLKAEEFLAIVAAARQCASR